MGLPLLFSPACSSLPRQFRSMRQLFLVDGTTMEMWQGSQTWPSQSTCGQVSSRRSSPSEESRELKSLEMEINISFEKKKKKKKKKNRPQKKKKKKKKKK